MASFRMFRATDLFKISNINLDKFTENYQISFYLYYMARWPDMNHIAVSPQGVPMGYFMGKAEGEGKEWHGHVTAVTVAPEYRRLGLAERLMRLLESISDRLHGFFVDLYVRASNAVAIQMYGKLGYIVYRRVLGYYSADATTAEEDAYDMRKALSRDFKKESMIPCRRPVRADEVS